MPFRTRTSSRYPVKAPPRSRFEELHGFEPYQPRKMATRNRTVNYRKSDPDSDDEVIYVGQRSKPKPKTQSGIVNITPAIPPPTIKPGDDEYREETLIPPKQHIVTDNVIIQCRGRPIFQTVPCEIHQYIASYLEEDFDVVRYARLCKQTRDSISSSVWRERFVRTFDMPEEELGPLALAKKYAYRKDIAGWVCFDWKKFGATLSRQEKKLLEHRGNKCLTILKDLIIDSNAHKSMDSDGKQIIIGLNHKYIREWVTHGRRHTDIIEAVFNTEVVSWNDDDIVSSATANSLILVIQLCLTSLSLHPDCCNCTVSHFDMSQRSAYADHKKQPVFVGGWKQDVNVRWLLHTVNFFKLHLKAAGGEGLLAQQYEDLESDELPQPWLGRIREGTQPIGSHWKAAHTFMKDNATLQKLRMYGNDDEPMVDDGELFSDLTIFFDEKKFSSDAWPKAFEVLLNTNPYSVITSPRSRQTRAANATTTTKYELKTFYGTGRAPKAAHFYGRIHGLPEQQGIPGFQRISLIKFLPLKNGEYDECNVWAYEGCVLPGGRIIVGRWWDLTADRLNPADIFGGPFIWWNVNNSAAEPPISSEEALNFLDSIHDPNMGFLSLEKSAKSL